jgi:hypothetical protein
MKSKNILATLALFAFVLLMVSSCRSREKCPGVGKTEVKQLEQIG